MERNRQQPTHPVMSVKDVLLLIGGALLLIVIFQNIKAHEFRIFFWKLWVSPVLLILIMAGAGFLAGWLVARRRARSKAEKAAASQAAPPAAPPQQPPPAADRRPLA